MNHLPRLFLLMLACPSWLICSLVSQDIWTDIYKKKDKTSDQQVQDVNYLLIIDKSVIAILLPWQVVKSFHALGQFNELPFGEELVSIQTKFMFSQPMNNHLQQLQTGVRLLIYKSRTK